MYKIPPDNLNSPYVHATGDKPDGKHVNLVPNTIGGGRLARSWFSPWRRSWAQI
jgi:hypothetical protein